MKTSTLASSLVAALVLLGLHATGGVVINEIFYHAPNDIEGLEYVELYNPGDDTVDLGGWKLTKGIRFKFPAKTTLPAHSYLVVCRNLERFKEFYPVEALGPFKQSLSNTGELIQLENHQGEVIDKVEYQSRSPWSLGAAGYSSSLERICPTADSSLPENWASSPPAEGPLVPTGTPGKQNANFSVNLPPVVSKVSFAPISPSEGEPLQVVSDISDADGVGEVNLRYRVVGSGFEGPEQSVPMTATSGTRYSGSIPGQKSGQIVRFRIDAVDRRGTRRLYPSPTEPRPGLSAYVHETFQLGKIPIAKVINVGTNEFSVAQRGLKSPGRGGNPEENDKRFTIRQQIESGIDLRSLWFDLVLKQGLTADQAKQLRPIFVAKLSERDKRIDDLVESANLEEAAKTVPSLITTFNQSLEESVLKRLTAEQSSALSKQRREQAETMAKQKGQEFGPERVLRHFVPLEKELFEVSLQSELTAEQLPKVMGLFNTATKERGALLEPVGRAMKGDQEESREKLEAAFKTIQENLEKGLKSVLSSQQMARFEAWQQQNNSMMPGRNNAPKPPAKSQGASALVYVDPKTGVPELFDFIQVSERSAGYKVHFHKDQPLHGMTSINLIFEYNDRFVLAEPLAYLVYQKAGNAAELTDFVRFSIDDHLLGYQLLMEQPNKTFLQRNGLKGDGELYKILWYGNGIVGQHEKKTHPHTGHDDLLALINQLEKNQGDALWEVIQKNFNVPQVVNYFAVNMCLSHWDGFFNNFLTYHEVDGKWEMYPWDQDKTWGFHDGLEEGKVFTDMPLTFGMEGDLPPGWPKDKPLPKGYMMGDSWWRAGGYFSRPLLANPQFRKLFLARTREILETVYNETTFFPILEDLSVKLRDEVALRATAAKQDPKQAQERFDQNLKSLRTHLVERRKFLLAQKELQGTGDSK